MTQGYITRLDDRGVVTVAGPDAEKLLQSVITNDMILAEPAGALFAGLLSPQGKVLFDFLITRAGSSGEGKSDRPEPTFFLDVARDQAPSLAKRLMLYKLRANVSIKDESETHHVLAMWGENAAFNCLHDVTDPRLADLGLRAIGKRQCAAGDISSSTGAEVSAGAYHAHRIALGVPEGGKDYAFGDTFPHEALFDQLHGVSFTKGCYVGQEIVSRMEHRGTARRRIVQVACARALPPAGTPVKAGDVVIGALGSSDDNNGLAMLRLDRAAEFAAKGIVLTAGEAAVTYMIPAWAHFNVPPLEPQTGTA